MEQGREALFFYASRKFTAGNRLFTNCAGKNMENFLFPEGIWNVSESLPRYQIYPGALKAAEAGSVPIVPIAIDQRKKHFTINVGEKFYVESEDWKAECEKLRDVLATLKWEIWEHYPREKRTDIPENYYHNFLTERLAEWPQFNMEIIKNRIHR